MADDADDTKAAVEETVAPDAPADAPAAAPEAAAETEQAAAPVADPETCKGLVVGMDTFEQAVLDGEWEDSDFEYYLEPAGVLHGPLRCSRAPADEPVRGGLLMTRAAWQAKTVFIDDGINPEVYELSFPKEFGYVKSVSHYRPESREHAKYPWTKKY